MCLIYLLMNTTNATTKSEENAKIYNGGGGTSEHCQTATGMWGAAPREAQGIN